MADNSFASGLRNAGAKLTAQRLAVCQWLEETNSHPTATDIYEALRMDFPTMSLATVYNTLALLSELDLVHVVGTTEDGSTRYDPKTAPHLNLECMRCGEISDIDNIQLQHLEDIAVSKGFKVKDTHVVIHGLCAKCQGQP